MNRAGVRRDVVLVAGPRLAGTSSVLTALRSRFPEREFVEASQLGPAEKPLAVVFVVSAAAQLVGSDCALLDAVADGTAAVIAVVAKIDVHRTWRAVLDANQAVFAGHTERHTDVRWVGAAAAPDVGAPIVDELRDAMSAVLTSATLSQRNDLRLAESRLLALLARSKREPELRRQRSLVIRSGQLARAERTAILRSRVQQLRVELTFYARSRCNAVRVGLQQDASTVRRRHREDFADRVDQQAAAVVDEVYTAVTRQLAATADELGLNVADVPAPVEVGELPPLPRARPVENRLMALLGTSFGVGVALTLSRLVVGLSAVATAAGVFACGLIGVGLALWVAGMRRLLQDRAALDRWVGEVLAAVQLTLEQGVVSRVLSAETAFFAAAGERDAAAGVLIADHIAAIDRGLRDLPAPRAVEQALAGVRTRLSRF